MHSGFDVLPVSSAAALTLLLMVACEAEYASAPALQDAAALPTDSGGPVDAWTADAAVNAADADQPDALADTGLAAACVGADLNVSVSLGTQLTFFDERVVCIETAALACDAEDNSVQKGVAPFMRLSLAKNAFLLPMFRCSTSNESTFVYAGPRRACTKEVLLGYCAPTPLGGCGLDKALYAADRDSRQKLSFVATNASDPALGRVCYVGSAQ
jgi:hypothetical protein